jgi:hypothetical protein
MAARKGNPEHDTLNGTSKMGQEDDAMQIRNARTDRTAIIQCPQKKVRGSGKKADF